MDFDEKKEKRGCVGAVVATIVIIAFFMFAIVGFASCEDTTPANPDGGGKLFSRSAKNSDIVVDADIDFGSLGVKYTIMPNTDIKNLKLEIKLLDKDKKVLDTVAKNIGNVKEGVQFSFSISLIDLGLSTAWNTSYCSCNVTGGTISYFK